MLIDFVAVGNVAISSTTFRHRNIHKTTWHSPNSKTNNQIVAIDGRYAFSVLDERRFQAGTGANQSQTSKSSTPNRQLKLTCESISALKIFLLMKLQHILQFLTKVVEETIGLRDCQQRNQDTTRSVVLQQKLKMRPTRQH